MKIIKSTKNRVYDKVWLNKNIRRFIIRLGNWRPHPSFRQCVYEERYLNIETKIDTPLF